MKRLLTPIAATFLGAALALSPVLAQDKPLDRAGVEAIVKDYIVKNPEIIQEALVELERRQKEAEAQAVLKITKDPKSPLYVSEHHTVAGNPNGNVTLVEFFDYNCGYCKRGLADVQKLIDSDKNVKVILKEFPILTPGSREASVVALALRDQFGPDKLWSFHAKLLNVKGSIGKEQALGVARELGADMAKLEAASASPKIAAALEESKLLADALSINGTPSYIVANDLIIGARGYDMLASHVANYRKCQKAVC
jgi:protein-disulfide isomerase